MKLLLFLFSGTLFMAAPAAAIDMSPPPLEAGQCSTATQDHDNDVNIGNICTAAAALMETRAQGQEATGDPFDHQTAMSTRFSESLELRSAAVAHLKTQRPLAVKQFREAYRIIDTVIPEYRHANRFAADYYDDLYEQLGRLGISAKP